MSAPKCCERHESSSMKCIKEDSRYIIRPLKTDIKVDGHSHCSSSWNRKRKGTQHSHSKLLVFFSEPCHLNALKIQRKRTLLFDLRPPYKQDLSRPSLQPISKIQNNHMVLRHFLPRLQRLLSRKRRLLHQLEMQRRIRGTISLSPTKRVIPREKIYTRSKILTMALWDGKGRRIQRIRGLTSDLKHDIS